MSRIAQSRDLADRRTILDFAHIVQTMDRLKLLLVLTVCDIRAVGPGVWNGWKGQLLRSLYYETEPILTGGFSVDASRSARIDEARSALAERLKDWPEEERERYLDLHYPAYWLRVDEDRQVRHAEFVRRCRRGRPEMRLRDPADDLRGGDRADGARARLSAAPLRHRRRLRRVRRQHRRRADLHHDRRPRARHRHHQPRLRQRRGRGAARQAHRQAHRAGARRARPARRGARRQAAEEPPPRGLPDRAAGAGSTTSFPTASPSSRSSASTATACSTT